MAIPLTAATVRGEKASVMVVEGGRARRGVHEVVGESQGTLYVAPTLPAGASVVTEGRALLREGDEVRATPAPTSPPPPAPDAPSSPGTTGPAR
jgi:hypothetical protein